MTTITMMLMSITMFLTVITVPRLYWAMVRGEELIADREIDLLKDFLAERNSWVLRQCGCGAVALAVVLAARQLPAFEVPEPLAASTAVYAVASLLFAFLDSLMAQKVAKALCLSRTPLRVRTHDNR